MAKSNFPYEAIAVIGRILDDNEAKHGNNAKWRSIPWQDHVIHATNHLYRQEHELQPEEDHLAHALTSLAMAVCVRMAEDCYKKPWHTVPVNQCSRDEQKDFPGIILDGLYKEKADSRES